MPERFAESPQSDADGNVKSEIEDMNPEGKELLLNALSAVLEGNVEWATECVTDFNDLEIVDAEMVVKRLLRIIIDEYEQR